MAEYKNIGLLALTASATTTEKSTDNISEVTEAERKRQLVADAIMNIARKALCLRLSLDPEEDELTSWAQIGILLAKSEPEFKHFNAFGRRGRPKKAKESKVDFRRVQVVDSMRADFPGKSDIEILAMIDDYLSSLPPESPRRQLFSKNTSPETLAQSVSRGRGILRKNPAN